MTLSPVPPPPAAKRPRLTRAVSGPAAVSTTPVQITLPLNQLGGLPLGKVLTVASGQGSANLGGYTLLTSSGAELAADTSNLTVLSTGAGQEAIGGGTFVNVVGGQQIQLVTLPAGLQGVTGAPGATLQQPVAGISLVDITTAAAQETQVEEMANGVEEEQVKSQEGGEEEEEQQQLVEPQ